MNRRETRRAPSYMRSAIAATKDPADPDSSVDSFAGGPLSVVLVSPGHRSSHPVSAAPRLEERSRGATPGSA